MTQKLTGILETALDSLTISSSTADTGGVHLDTPISSISGDIKTGVSYFHRFPNFPANKAAPIQAEFKRLAKIKDGRRRVISIKNNASLVSA